MADAGTSESTPISLKSLWDKSEQQRKGFEGFQNTNTSSYKDAVAEALTTISACKDAIDQLSLFSSNESLEDVATNELKYLLVDSYRADVLMKQHGAGRLKTLEVARSSYRSFLSLCESYGLLGDFERKAFLRSADPSPNAFNFHSDAAARRDSKIARYKQEKELKAKLEHLSKSTQSPNVDDEEIRSLYLARIQLAVMQSIQQLEGIALEVDILGRAPSEEQLLEQRRQQEDERTRRRAEDNYSDRVDPSEIFTKANGRPLLSSDGKPLRPFTLLDNREKLKGQVFGPGHRLPTMTIDEYLEEEQKRGNILSGGGPQSGVQPEPDEDNLALADQETYKAREWDEFKEANPKGSGNTLNRG